MKQLRSDDFRFSVVLFDLLEYFFEIPSSFSLSMIDVLTYLSGLSFFQLGSVSAIMLMTLWAESRISGYLEISILGKEGVRRKDS